MSAKRKFRTAGEARRNAAFHAITYGVLAVISWWLVDSVLAFGLFSLLCVLACIYIVRVEALFKRSVASEVAPMNSTVRHEPTAYGVLGKYEVDGDLAYGLFVEMGGRPVFVDLREDKLLSKRETYAAQIYSNAAELWISFAAFLDQSSQFRGLNADRIKILSIGLYSKEEPELAEVYVTIDGRDDGKACLLEKMKFRDI